MSLYQKGQSGNPAGKPKGTKNKYTLGKIKDIGALFEARNFDPIIRMIDIAEHAESQKIQLDACKELAQYAYQKLRSIEHTGTLNLHEKLLDLLK